MKLEDWEAAAGVPCPTCGRESFRLFRLRRGRQACYTCYLNDGLLSEKRAERKYLTRLLAQGRVNLAELKAGRY